MLMTKQVNEFEGEPARPEQQEDKAGARTDHEHEVDTYPCIVRTGPQRSADRADEEHQCQASEELVFRRLPFHLHQRPPAFVMRSSENAALKTLLGVGRTPVGKGTWSLIEEVRIVRRGTHEFCQEVERDAEPQEKVAEQKKAPTSAAARNEASLVVGIGKPAYATSVGP